MHRKIEKERQLADWRGGGRGWEGAKSYDPILARKKKSRFYPRVITERTQRNIYELVLVGSFVKTSPVAWWGGLCSVFVD
jgi:hypothetical protein